MCVPFSTKFTFPTKLIHIRLVCLSTSCPDTIKRKQQIIQLKLRNIENESDVPDNVVGICHALCRFALINLIGRNSRFGQSLAHGLCPTNDKKKNNNFPTKIKTMHLPTSQIQNSTRRAKMSPTKEKSCKEPRP